MKPREYHIGLCGTFDVRNFGDLLFPLIAEKELKQRLGEVKIHPFSYHAKSMPDWPYEVTSLTDLPRRVQELDGILIGGGHLIRFDKGVAPGYAPPSATIHHPTGYWLVPALLAVAQGIPLMWNAPGVHENVGFPFWSRPLLESVLQNSAYIAVRDEESRIILSRYSDRAQINTVPDSAFGISDLLGQGQRSQQLEHLRLQVGLTRPYIIVQATDSMDSFLEQMGRSAEVNQKYQWLILPIGPDVGDHPSAVKTDLPNCIFLDEWPHPLLIAELIRQADGIIGTSFHFSIVALVFGVPVFRPASYFEKEKYKTLSIFQTVFHFSDGGEQPEWFLSKLGRSHPLHEVEMEERKLSSHWDSIATAILRGKRNPPTEIGSLLSTLPILLEEKETLEKEKEVLEKEKGTLKKEKENQEKENKTLNAELVARDNLIQSLYNSRSWKVTSPLRGVTTILKTILGRR
jgi:lipopolysaccharide transport system ATP-binding protein